MLVGHGHRRPVLATSFRSDHRGRLSASPRRRPRTNGPCQSCVVARVRSRVRQARGCGLTPRALTNLRIGLKTPVRQCDRHRRSDEPMVKYWLGRGCHSEAADLNVAARPHPGCCPTRDRKNPDFHREARPIRPILRQLPGVWSQSAVPRLSPKMRSAA